jgi:hypothetical protein
MDLLTRAHDPGSVRAHVVMCDCAPDPLVGEKRHPGARKWLSARVGPREEISGDGPTWIRNSAQQGKNVFFFFCSFLF